jgi:exodeoxyribonuclease VII small subunit
MSKAAKSSSGVATEKELSFEAALNQLESIVEAMESDTLPLETMLEKFEEGSRLAKVCQNRLAEAELKVQQVEKAAGGFDVKPMAEVAEA